MSLPRRTLLAMRTRWQRDLDRIERAYSLAASDDAIHDLSNSESETIRNLATAIAEIDGMIARRRPGDPK